MTDYSPHEMEEIDGILEETRELGRMIREHEITRQYMETLDKIRNDRVAMSIISDLIRMGEDLQLKGSRGEAMSIEQTAENQLLRQRMEENPLVKEHLMAQKRYLNLINLVMERLREPAGVDPSVS